MDHSLLFRGPRLRSAVGVCSLTAAALISYFVLRRSRGKGHLKPQQQSGTSGCGSMSVAAVQTEPELFEVSRRQKKTNQIKEKPLKKGLKRKMDADHELHPKQPLAKKKTVVENEQRQSTGASSAQPTDHPHKQSFESRYSVGELLGEGGCGSVYAGVRMADGKKVAIKYVAKNPSVRFLAIPGETHQLPLEVALMQLVSKPPQCKEVLELLEWIEMPTCFILILERPDPCMDLFEFCQNSPQPEFLAQIILLQVILAVHHCHERGVFHRDIKAENILIHPDTLDVKLIDFGCGDLLRDGPYRKFSGTELYVPPEWILEGQYQGLPATIWSLGILLFDLVCGDIPFKTMEEIVDGNIDFRQGVSKDTHIILEKNFWRSIEKNHKNINK